MIAKTIKKRQQPKWRVTLLFILIAVIVGFLLFSNWRIKQRRKGLESQIIQLRESVEGLEQRREELRAQVIQTNEELFWETKAREQGYQKPGEEMAVILSPETSEEPARKDKGFWQRFKFW